MSGSIARSVQQVKGELRSLVTPSQIMRQCQSAGHGWRHRTLGPVETIYLFSLDCWVQHQFSQEASSSASARNRA